MTAYPRDSRTSIGSKLGLVALMAFGLLATAHAVDNQPTLRVPVLLAQATKPAAKAPAGNPVRAKADLDALINAAKAEGEVTIYSAAPDSVPRRTGTAFTAKYGIKSGFIRLSTAPLAQRYFAEAESGTFAADIIITAGGLEPYFPDGLKKGWVEPMSQANLPVLTGGEFPERFYDGVSPVVQISPWMIAYNKDQVKGADIPKDWADMLDPKWKGKILLADPRVGLVFTQFWNILHERYGDGFFAQLRAQNPRRYPGGIPAVQGLAAGEGAMYPPVIPPVVTGVQERGAPVDTVTPEFTTGTQFYLILTARGKAKHPNAARLLANYIMSPEGNTVFNDEPGIVGVYDTRRLPKQYVQPKPVNKEQVDNMARLLGF